MKSRTKTSLAQVVIGTLCAAMIALCGLFMSSGSVLLYCSAVVALSVFGVAFCAVDGEKYPHASRTMLVCAVVAAVVVGCYILYIKTGLSQKFTDFDALKQFILDSGFWGIAIFIGLTVFQVVVLPIPEAVTILLGVAIYGATWSFVLSVIGTIIGSLISFVLGKVFGRRLCNWMFGEETTEKYAKLLGDKGRFLFIIMLLFPAFPDDMLCMIAGITTMSYAYFTIVCLVTRPVMIGLTAYLGSGAIPFSGWGIPVWIAIVCLMFVVFVVVSKLKTKMENGRRKN
ncbi:MAG: TVP38/TMEM64 family protein [Clostridiales bacterium]|nr:TVP38/TMEM64 family protein [Clostridiales bacterium]